MRQVSNTAGSISSSPSSGKAGDSATSFTGQDYYQDLIDKANSVPLIRIFKLYGIRLDQYNRKTTCPFKSHKGGREHTASFNYYPETNTYFCFGCKIGSRPCDFVAEMDKCNKVKASHKILDQFSADVDEDNIYDRENFSERLEIMLDFSEAVRDFRQTYNDEKSQEFIEFVSSVYDQHNLKRNLDNEALRRMVGQIKEKIRLYTP